MVGFVIFLHIVACLILVFIVLLQTGKGSEIGAVFGTSSSSVFGPTGPATILSKITIGAAIVFILTSLYLTYSFSKPALKTLMPGTKTAPQPSSAPTSAPAPVQQAPSQTPAQSQPASQK